MPPSDIRPQPAALQLVAESVGRQERVLVIGGSGWFGRTALALLHHAMGGAWSATNVLAVAGSARAIDILGVGRVEVAAPDPELVAGFAPTLVLNCAFPPRSQVAALGLEGYVAAADAMRGRLFYWCALPSVRRVVTLSSGAAIPSEKYPAVLSRNPYGVLKAREADGLLELAAAKGFNLAVMRVWAASGPHVQAPRDYALSDFLLQAAETGQIVVRANRPVVRNYSSADDILAIALYAASSGACLVDSGVVDSGGEQIELGDLAQLVANCCGGVPVVRGDFDPDAPADTYVSDEQSWLRMTAELGFVTTSLTDQVQAAYAGLIGW